jgi:hypothetical protein
MDSKKNILVLLFVLLVNVSQAQENRVFIPPDMALKTFTLKEYAIKDSSFYNELCSILFSDTVFGSQVLSIHAFSMCYDTTIKQFDYLTGENFSASFSVFGLIDEANILSATDEGKKAIGYFYIKDMVCFILKPTQTDFISQYLILTNKKRLFKFYDSLPVVGGSSDVYMNILSNGKIDVVRILRSE